MPVAYLDDGQYNTMSSLSIVASRASLAAQDVTATSQLSASLAQVQSAATVRSWLYAGVFLSSATTAQSGATSRISQQGQMYFSVLSLTSNGGEFGFRSGNTVYRFSSDLAG